MSIESEIQNAISAHLPAQVGEVLRKQLEQANIATKTLETTNYSLIRVTKERDELKRTLDKVNSELSVFKNWESDLIKREKEIQKLELTAQFEKEKTELVKAMFSTVFHNRTLRETVLTPQRLTNVSNGHSSEHIEYTTSTSTKEEC